MMRKYLQKKSKRTAKVEPADPYECWIMPCNDCVYWNEKKEKCEHPEVLLWDGSEDFGEE